MYTWKWYIDDGNGSSLRIGHYFLWVCTFSISLVEGTRGIKINISRAERVAFVRCPEILIVDSSLS